MFILNQVVLWQWRDRRPSVLFCSTTRHPVLTPADAYGADAPLHQSSLEIEAGTPHLHDCKQVFLSFVKVSNAEQTPLLCRPCDREIPKNAFERTAGSLEGFRVPRTILQW